MVCKHLWVLAQKAFEGCTCLSMAQHMGKECTSNSRYRLCSFSAIETGWSPIWGYRWTVKKSKSSCTDKLLGRRWYSLQQQKQQPSWVYWLMRNSYQLNILHCMQHISHRTNKPLKILSVINILPKQSFIYFCDGFFLVSRRKAFKIQTTFKSNLTLFRIQNQYWKMKNMKYRKNKKWKRFSWYTFKVISKHIMRGPFPSRK